MFPRRQAPERRKDEVNDVTQKVEKRGRPLTRNVKICKCEKDSGGISAAGRRSKG